MIWKITYKIRSLIKVNLNVRQVGYNLTNSLKLLQYAYENYQCIPFAFFHKKQTSCSSKILRCFLQTKKDISLKKTKVRNSTQELNVDLKPDIQIKNNVCTSIRDKSLGILGTFRSI